MKIYRIPFIFVLVVVLWSCKNDNDDTTPVAVPLQTLSETAIENDADIQAYLKTHFYKYENSQIVIDTIAGDNSSETALIDQVETNIISVLPSELNLDEDTDISVDHKLYYLIIENGAEEGNFITASDSTFLNYEGSRLDGEIFDSRIGSPVWFDILGNPLLGTSGVISGFQKGLTKFKEAGAIVENVDGTFVIEEPSTGFIIMPSGLAYFASSIPGDSYAPLVFKLSIIRTLNADHDRDGVPTIFEDLGNDEDWSSDDTDEDVLPNYIDGDDDGDGISTREEISDDDGNIITPYPDTDGDGIADYLDSDS